MSEQEKKAYRRAIWLEWRKIVARKKLTSHEYKLVDQWFAQGVAVEVIWQAIKRAVDRAVARSTTVYSLGFISSDIVAVQRDLARMHVGDRQPEARSGNWREAFSEKLEILIRESDFCLTMQENFRQLKADLPKLTHTHAEELCKEIAEDGCR